MPRLRRLSLVLAGALVVAGCTPGSTPPAATATSAAAPTQAPPRTALPPDATTVVEGATAAALAIATSRALFRRAPAVVLAGDGDGAAVAAGGSTAAALGVPLLLAPAAGSADTDLRAELSRLGPRTLVTEGAAAAAWAQRASAGPGDAVSAVADGGDSTALPDVVPDPPLNDLLVLALDGATSAAAIATARAAGARIVGLKNPDPRSSSDAVRALAGQATARILALGAAFGPASRLRQRVDTAATGVLLPGGGQVVFPGRRMVALYGHPGDRILGCLGEQSLAATVVRAKKVAAAYSSLVDEPVVPAFEIIATVASSSAGSDGDYSAEAPVATLRPWVDAARAAGIYVVLDLQPGRTDFLTQAKRYEELLTQPNVGLALDPEWRLKPGQFHMEQIGSVSAAEINRTAAWLAQLTREHHLPQKVLMVHQFRLDMITDRGTLDASYDELRVVIHVDGFGSAGQKLDTWRTIHRQAPAGVWWGWKNFYDEDKPTFTPVQTVGVAPSPVFVSYQ